LFFAPKLKKKKKRHLKLVPSHHTETRKMFHSTHKITSSVSKKSIVKKTAETSQLQFFSWSHCLIYSKSRCRRDDKVNLMLLRTIILAQIHM